MTDLREAVPTRVERARTSPARSASLGRLPSVRERTRTLNRDPINRSSAPDPESGFWCECARPGCSVRLPLAVERHRRLPELFIVASGHVDGDIVVGAADRFMIVEQNAIKGTAARTARVPALDAQFAPRFDDTGSSPNGSRKESR